MFSVVMPTYNRASILERTLLHLSNVEGISLCEVIVIDDGSTDETPAVLERAAHIPTLFLKVIRLSNGGPARARNAGLRTATFDRILFIDDDVFPRNGMLAHHEQMLDKGFTGSQGLLLWHPEIQLTPLIHYIDSRGSQFAFDHVRDPSNLSFANVYTGNFAVLRSAVLEAGGFDETFFDKDLAFGAFEDTILGYKLEKRGARLALNEEAVADHLHPMSEEAFLAREFKVGYNIGRLQLKYPTIAEALGLEHKGRLFASGQYRILRAINASPLSRLVSAYPVNMRLRHREAFYQGILHFRQVHSVGVEAA